MAISDTDPVIRGLTACCHRLEHRAGQQPFQVHLATEGVAELIPVVLYLLLAGLLVYRLASRRFQLALSVREPVL